MYYIQRFRDARKNSGMAGAHRLITPECSLAAVGIPQIEFCYQWLRRQEIAIHPVRFEKLNVTMYVIGTQESLDRFKSHIHKYFCSEPISRTARGTPGLYERFVSKDEEKVKPFSKTNVWMEVTSGIANEYADSIAPPVLFTADRFMAIRLYLELQVETLNPDRIEANILDKAYCFRSKLEHSVIGLNEDDTITVRNSENTIRLHKRDVWPREIFPLQKLQEFGVF